MISLANWVRQFPGVRLAQPEDNASLRAFFESAPMKIPDFDIRYERAPHFFDLLKAHGGRFFVFIGEDVDGAPEHGSQGRRIVGTGTLVLRDGWIEGQPVTVGIFRDLRVMPSRRNSKLWREIYAALLSERESIEELKGCHHFQTVILDGNRQALAAFNRIAGATSEQSTFGLKELAPFRMLNLIARYPWAGRAFPGLDVVQANRELWPSLELLFEASQKPLAFGFRETLAERLKRWPGLALQDYLVVLRDRKPVAFAAPWSPTQAKRTWVSRLPIALSILEKVTRPFPRCGIRLPRAGETLRSLTLSQLTFSPQLSLEESRRACAALVHYLFNSKNEQGWHCLSICDYRAWNLAIGLDGFMQHAIPITVYTIEPNPHRTHQGPCGFEMGLV